MCKFQKLDALTQNMSFEKGQGVLILVVVKRSYIVFPLKLQELGYDHLHHKRANNGPVI
jgi:hypothetical protein